MINRIEKLTIFLEKDPNDSFARYALALELQKIGNITEGILQLEHLKATNPDYLGTYYQLGKMYESQQAFEFAEKVYKEGIIKATKANDSHTKSELMSALMNMSI